MTVSIKKRPKRQAQRFTLVILATWEVDMGNLYN
jgi:hypothetical protein